MRRQAGEGTRIRDNEKKAAACVRTGEKRKHHSLPVRHNRITPLSQRAILSGKDRLLMGEREKTTGMVEKLQKREGKTAAAFQISIHI